MQSEMALRGKVGMRVQRAKGPGLAWKLENSLRDDYVWGWFCNGAAKLFSKITRIPTITAELSARVLELLRHQP